MNKKQKALQALERLKFFRERIIDHGGGYLTMVTEFDRECPIIEAALTEPCEWTEDELVEIVKKNMQSPYPVYREHIEVIIRALATSGVLKLAKGEG